MSNSFIIHLIIWIGLWAGIAALYVFYLSEHGIEHTKNFYLASLYYGAATVAYLFIFRTYVNIAVTHSLLFSTAALLLVVLLAHVLIRKFLTEPKEFIQNNPKVYFATLNYSHFVSNTFIILFQQITFIILTNILHRKNFSFTGIILTMIALFISFHAPLVKTLGRFWGLYLTTSSIAGAIIFPWLYLYSSNGFLYAFMLHWLFYIASGLAIWIYQPKTKQF